MVTIIILLILAGITISSLTNSGLFNKVKEAKGKWQNAQNEEEKQIDKYSNEIDNYIEANRNETNQKDILFPKSNEIPLAYSEGTKYDLKSSFLNYSELLVCAYSPGNAYGNWVGSVTMTIPVEDILIIDENKDIKDCYTIPFSTWSIAGAGGTEYMSIYFENTNSFTVYKTKSQYIKINKIYGIK